MWKLDLIILPVLLIVFMVSFLDRISMGNAKYMGLMDDLSLTVKKYNIAYFVRSQRCRLTIQKTRRRRKELTPPS